jgi:hypothetical protein
VAEKYGGSTLYYSADHSDQGDVENPIYLPILILIWDVGVVSSHDHRGKMPLPQKNKTLP